MAGEKADGQPQQAEMKEYRKKICLLGEYAVGKTSLVRRYVNSVFDDLYILTIGVKVTSKELTIKERNAKFVFAIWDIGGHLDPSDVPETYYLNTAGAIVVCDVSRKETLERAKDWVKLATRQNTEQVPIVLVANKCDLPMSFTEDDVKSTAAGMKAPYFMVSAKTGQNVESAFSILANKMLDKYK